MNVATILTLTALTLSAAEFHYPENGESPLVAHEWGTFTSVAGEDGNPVEWAPLFGAPDLPCFVARAGNIAKAQIPGLVRMETPVLYFYAQRPLTLAVRVDFPQGLITEWYPRASKVAPDVTMSMLPASRDGSIEWNAVKVLPGARLMFPSTTGASRYYAARETDSAPLRIEGQQEKLIFYRGVGSFPPPLRPRYRSDGRLEIRNAGSDSIPLAIVFENHNGKIRYQVVRDIKDSVSLDAQAPAGDFERLRRDLTTELVEFGLYPKEAAAMVGTWRDSWFEEGTRVLYIVPRPEVDALLPLSVTPTPVETMRVFVGRVEVLSPATKQTIADAAAAGDARTLEQFGRFLGIYAHRLALRGPVIRNALDNFRRNNTAPCIQ